MDSIVELEHELTRPPWGAAGRALTLGLVSGFAKVMLTMVNSMTVENKDTLLKHVMERPPGVGLVTVSNHTRWVGMRPAAWGPAFGAAGVGEPGGRPDQGRQPAGCRCWHAPN